MSFQRIILEKNQGVAKITLNRPEVLNALNESLLLELEEALEDIRNDTTVDVVILTGAGRAFCAGMDLKAVAEGHGKETQRPDQVSIAKDVFEAISALNQPVIAAVNGYAITGGLELAISCDMIVASDSAVLGDTHCRLGTIPAAGDGTRLPRLVGIMKAKEMILTSEMISAEEALRIGLVNRVVPAEKLDEVALEIAQKLRANNQVAVRAAKALIDKGMNTGLDMALTMEWATFQRFNEKQRLKITPESMRATIEKTKESLR